MLPGYLFKGVADASAATQSIQSYLKPVLTTLAVLAALIAVIVVIYSGYMYATHGGNASRLERAKRVFRNAAIGLLIIGTAASVTGMLHHAYSTPAKTSGTSIPQIEEIKPADTGSGWSTILIDAITGFLSNIAQSLASPLLDQLQKLTRATPLMHEEAGVVKIYAVTVAIAGSLFTLVLVLLGFKVMTGEFLGLDEIELSSVIPQIISVYLVMVLSIFAIDAIIGLSNAIIAAIYAGLPGTDIWSTLTSSMARLSGLPLASLILFIVFIIFAGMLLVYYVARWITLFLGAVMAPFVVLIWLLPGFRDFANNLIRTYLMVIFVLVVHVVILMLGGVLLGLQNSGPTGVPNPLMAIIIGIATLLLLLKTQGVLVQMSLVSSGMNNSRKLGTQFANGARYTADKAMGHEASGFRSQYAVARIATTELK
jgi:hypothetical protein